MAALNKTATCDWILTTCPFVRPAFQQTCVQQFCLGKPYGFGSCVEFFHGEPSTCCSEPNTSSIASCMATWQAAQGYGASRDPCLLARDYVQECELIEPGFSSQTRAQQAQCLCFDANNTYIPDVWDSAVASCVSTGEKAHPTIWSSLKSASVEGLCTKFAGTGATVSRSVATKTSTQSGATPTATGPVTTSDAQASAGTTIVPGSTSGAAASSSALNSTQTTTRSGTTSRPSVEKGTLIMTSVG
ncbi:hypothetical protein GQ53DRAFT_757765 [Thozetella sp. PMI_491]|nr:hypothetical protein GQ53DRAFT_757765 [Thozetella sp. PMI_491]